MRNKSTYFLSLPIILLGSILASTSCAPLPLAENNYSASTPGYEQAKIKHNISQRRQIIAQSTAPQVQNPKKIPVIINDPFALGHSLATAQGNGQQYGQQRQQPYGSLANSEQHIIKPNIFTNTPSAPNYYRPPTFGSNSYSPVRR